MASSELNYFTCTLGQAAVWNESHPHVFHTVNDLIDQQADRRPNAPAVGFPLLPGSDRFGPWVESYVTYAELKIHSVNLATRLAHILQLLGRRQTRTVGLLCSSSPEFVMVWLALIRLGLSVLLIAYVLQRGLSRIPQCQKSAIEHLCETCNAMALFADDTYAEKASEVEGDIMVIVVGQLIRRIGLDPSAAIEGRSDPSDIAYLHHTSGTSTGLPKPIPQSHKAAVGVLPAFPEGHHAATFSTTPLYHGGIADCFRAWTSGSMIWLFPERNLPITAKNILDCVEYVSTVRPDILPGVRYFSSVPYILQMLAENPDGLKFLQDRDIVGVGGAALPPAVGDELVQKDVNLISRFGSAECGFLMSSHRHYKEDRDWQYLRPGSGSRFMSFETTDNGLYELVINSGWPHLAKTNREDGSYATSDLFEPHETIAGAWRYHSRADAQITLITGKKFDPAPVEAAILSSTKVLGDVLIFGTGENYPGALLFPSSELDASSEEVLNEVWPALEQINHDSQPHARLPKSMLVVVNNASQSFPLEKSSKGTIMRRKAEERFAEEIRSAYRDKDPHSYNNYKPVSDAKVAGTVNDIVNQVIGRRVDQDTDLFAQGIDSAACLQIRELIGSRVLPAEASPLPLNIVYDCGTTRALAQFVLGRRRGEESREPDELELMTQLVETYSNFEDHQQKRSMYADGGDYRNAEVVVLTGATGALGAHILNALRSDPKVSKIYCLLRAQNPLTAHQRVTKSLKGRAKPDLEPFDERAWRDGRIVCFPSRFSDNDLGLSEEDYASIISTATLVIHSAWTVNFNLRLRSFVEDHIAGTRHLIDLTSNSPAARLLFISSTAAVASSPLAPIPESVSKNSSDASPLGYSRSKWVAEAVCSEAYKHFYRSPSNRRPQPSISILRVGQLCGDTIDGIWNASEAYPLMLSSAKITGSLPDLATETLNWLPVDLAAQAVFEIGLTNSCPAAGQTGEVPIYHILNAHSTPKWPEMVDWINQDIKQSPYETSSAITTIPPAEWVQELESTLAHPASHSDNDKNHNKQTLHPHPSTSLLPLWKCAFSSPSSSFSSSPPPPPTFSIQNSTSKSTVIRDLQPLDKHSVIRMWRWIEKMDVGS